MRALRYALHLALTVTLVVAVLTLVPHRAVQRALAAFNPSPQAWTAAYELDPTATDPVSQGDDHLRQAKTETRDRAETEHQWGSGLGLVTTDTGRHLFGSARVFSQNAAPTIDGTITANCLTEADRDGNRGCDAGRLWVDGDGANNIAADHDDLALFLSVDADADLDADAWFEIGGPARVPVGALVLWDQSNTCPVGYTEATEYRNLHVVGADRAAGDTGIPDNAGVSCTGAAAPAGCGSAGGVANYNVTQDTNELAAHTHTTPAQGQLLAGGGAALNTVNGPGTTLTTSTGLSQPSYGPLRTVLFCRKS
jgi:hypothetical protein